MIPRKECEYNIFIISVINAHRSKFFLFLLFSISGLLFSFISPLLLKMLVDEFLINKDIQIFPFIIISLVLFHLISTCSDYFSHRIQGELELQIFNELSAQLFNAIIQTSIRDIEHFKIGDLLSRTMGNCYTLIQTIVGIVPQLFLSLIMIIIPFLIMVSLNPILTLVSMIPITGIIISSCFFGGQIKEKQRPVLESSANLNSLLKEAYSNILLIQSSMLDKWINSKFEFTIKNFFSTSMLSLTITSLSSSINLFFNQIPFIGVIIFGGIAVYNNNISLGVFTAFIAYIGLFYSPIQHLSFLWTTYKGSYANYERVSELLNLPKYCRGEKEMPKSINNIELVNITFSYDNKEVIKNFNANFCQGINYLVGKNGSGKSTIVKLICGLYTVDEGEILFDKINCSNYNIQSIRSSISVIFPDFSIFSGTIYENIHIGNLSATYDKIISASKKANLHTFIMKLPNQYDTEIGESGYNLSSGEKQKIILARTILKDSPVIILDEFSNSIDSESKSLIFSLINNFKDRIIIIITHDPADINSDSNLIQLPNIELIERPSSLLIT